MSNSQADRLAERLTERLTLGGPFIIHLERADVEVLLAALAKQQASPEAQPVATVRFDSGEVHIMPSVRDAESSPLRDGQKLYATPPSAPQVPAVAQAVPMVVTDEMVTAYLTANDAYWKRTDELPQQNPGKWRNGTPREATRVSLEAALSQGTSQAAATACKLTECQGQPRCRYCVAKDARAAATGGVQISDALEKALDRMDRARNWLTDGKPRPECNWGVLDTSDLRAILAEAGIREAA